MGKKKMIMKFPSLFWSSSKKDWTTTTRSHYLLRWQYYWSSCNHPSTLSFRATADEMFKTINSVFYDPSDEVETPETWFTNSSDCASVSSESEAYCSGSGDQSLETIIRGMRSERLFFEPGGKSSVLVETEETTATATGTGMETAKTEEVEMVGLLPFKESVALAMESKDPIDDFRRSMEEMVESHGLKDWDCLKELLGWYLKVNEKVNHGFIVGAFVDLLLGIASSNDQSTSFSSAASTFSSLSSPSSPVCSDGDHVMDTTVQ